MTFNHSSKALTRFECQWFWDVENSLLDALIHGGVHCCLFCDLFPHHFGDLNDSCESFGLKILMISWESYAAIIFYKSSETLLRQSHKATRKSYTRIFFSRSGRHKRKHFFGFLLKDPRLERFDEDERSLRNKQTKTCVRVSSLEARVRKV